MEVKGADTEGGRQMGRFDRLVKGMAALLISGLAGSLVGLIAGAGVGLLFFGIGALFGGVAGFVAGFPTGILGALFRTRPGWIVAGILGAMSGGGGLLLAFGGNGWVKDGFKSGDASSWFGIAIFIVLPALAGALMGILVGRGLEKGDGVFASWRVILNRLGWYEETVVERFTSFGLLVLSGVGVWQFCVALSHFRH